MKRRIGMGAAGITLALAGCATIAPDGARAVATLESVVERGCMAYALGEKPAAAAMQDAALKRKSQVLSYPSPLFTFLPLPPPPTGQRYASNAPGGPMVGIYGPGCTVHVRGTDVAGFESALDGLYRRRFGEGYANWKPPAQQTDPQFPGMKRFCAAGHIFQSYPDPPDSTVQGGFNVMISPEPPSYCIDRP